MDKHELLERHEATGDESLFLEPKPIYERALADPPDPPVLLD